MNTEIITTPKPALEKIYMTHTQLCSELDNNIYAYKTLMPPYIRRQNAFSIKNELMNVNIYQFRNIVIPIRQSSPSDK